MTQDAWWIAFGAALVLAILAALGDRRRTRRVRIDDIGWMPWRGLQVVAIFAALACLILASKP